MARWEIGETEDQPYSLPPNSYGGCFVLMSPVFLIRKQAYLTDISGSFRAWCWYGLSSGEGLMVDGITNGRNMCSGRDYVMRQEVRAQLGSCENIINLPRSVTPVS